MPDFESHGQADAANFFDVLKRRDLEHKLVRDVNSDDEVQVHFRNNRGERFSYTKSKGRALLLSVTELKISHVLTVISSGAPKISDSPRFLPHLCGTAKILERQGIAPLGRNINPESSIQIRILGVAPIIPTDEPTESDTKLSLSQANSSQIGLAENSTNVAVALYAYGKEDDSHNWSIDCSVSLESLEFISSAVQSEKVAAICISLSGDDLLLDEGAWILPRPVAEDVWHLTSTDDRFAQANLKIEFIRVDRLPRIFSGA